MQLYESNYNTAQGVANRPYTPYSGEGVAGFNPTQLQAQGILGNIGTSNIGNDALNSAVSGTQGILGQTGANGQTLAGTDLSPYMNPYQQSVIDTTMGGLDLARQRQRVADNQDATQQGAFGGNRQGVADSLTNEAYYNKVAGTLAGLNSQNFGQAQNAAQFDLNRGLQSNQLGLQAANQMAGLSQDQLALAANRAGILGAVGDTQQQQQQQQDAWNYQQFLNQQNYPLLQQDIRNAALGLIPLQQTTTSRTGQTGIGGILGPLFSGASNILSSAKPGG